MKYHRISAKYLGWDNEGEDFDFPVDSYTEEEAIAQFIPVQKYSEIKRQFYTAYEYDGNSFYTVIYRGIVD